MPTVCPIVSQNWLKSQKFELKKKKLNQSQKINLVSACVHTTNHYVHIHACGRGSRSIFRCASISWFQVVSQSVIDVLRLAHLQVFQSYFGRGLPLPIPRNKKGKGKWCKWCVNNTCVWSKANSWFGLCVFIKEQNLLKLVLLCFLTKEKQNNLFLFLSVFDEK